MKTSLSLGCSAVLLLAGCAANTPPSISATTAQNAEALALAKEGHKFAEQGQIDAALAKVEQALALDPQLVKARFDRAQILLAQGQTQRAVADLDVAVAKEPTNQRYLGARCVALVVAGKEKEGLADCEKAVAQPDGPAPLSKVNALTARGQAYLALKRNEAALADFKAALALSPNSMRSLYGQGIALKRLGDKQGEVDIQEALRRLPGAGREYTLTALK
ncbi:MAG: tetratricopeptide repeat protein [Spongiibacteraceae bacterium]